jgi:hypothetical protein
MSAITWLHLSDWHQRGEDFNREVVRDRLIDGRSGSTPASPIST